MSAMSSVVSIGQAGLNQGEVCPLFENIKRYIDSANKRGANIVHLRQTVRKRIIITYGDGSMMNFLTVKEALNHLYFTYNLKHDALQRCYGSNRPAEAEQFRMAMSLDEAVSDLSVHGEPSKDDSEASQKLEMISKLISDNF